jgi:hypothetical protein
LFHAVWNVGDPALANVERAHFMKNMALVGACLALLALVADVGIGSRPDHHRPDFELDWWIASATSELPDRSVAADVASHATPTPAALY